MILGLHQAELMHIHNGNQQRFELFSLDCVFRANICWFSLDLSFLKLRTAQLHHIQKETECTYNATRRRVRAAIVAVEKQWVWHNLCLCVFVALGIPACNAHAPYFHLWPVRLYNIFPHYLIYGKGLKTKQVLEINLYFNFLYNFDGDIFILKRTERDMIKDVCLSSYKVPVSTVRF